MFIRKLTEEDLEALWEIRLQALLESPEAFGSTYEETLSHGKEHMRQRLCQGEKMFYLGAFEDRLIGIVLFSREERSKSQHKAFIHNMYVLPGHRGHSVGKALLQELILQAKQVDGLEQLHLVVMTTNPTARSLYHTLGFEIYGTARRALKQGEQYWDEDLMMLDIRNSG